MLEAAEPEVAIAAYTGVGHHLCRERNDIAAGIGIYEAGLRYGEAQASKLAETDPERADAVRWGTKVVAFNLASFLWPGWDDSPALEPAQVALGMRAARKNYELTAAANRGPKTLSVAHWLLGAHYLAAKDIAGALEHFESSAAFAREAGDLAGERSARGFAAVAHLVADPNDREAQSDHERIRSDLQDLEDGPFYASQFAPALAAFQP